MPYITNIRPEKNSTIIIGIEKIGGKLWPEKYNFPQRFNFQPYNISYNEIEDTSPNRLNITIADNPEYNNAIEYITEYVEKGEKAEVEHNFDVTGANYIKLVVESENGKISSPIEYTVDVIIVKYFIDEPDIQTQGVQANSITVRSPTAEYTAKTDPAPNADELVERLVEIDEGDQATCQAIAEALIVRWGKEQKSITGNINLSVTLKFKEKIRIIYNPIGLDEYMIIQKKVHDVTGRKTTITCGDIILSDEELLARILEER